MKRLIDLAVGVLLFLLSLPITAPLLLAVWLQDRRSPLYLSTRIGAGGRPFRMFKIRSMIPGASELGGDAAFESDPRITPLGSFIRRCKLDELPQIWNVLIGDMSLVGPRPNVEGGTILYTEEERRLFSVKPGLTDFASIIFSDLDEILEGSPDPDLEYNQRVRPWKSRLGLLYIENQSVLLDLKLLAITAVSLFSRGAALRLTEAALRSLNADKTLVEVAARQAPLPPSPPPGADLIETRTGYELRKTASSAR
ncbi:MAG: sugar transferase [Deltaproteobacteria bacterium]|nr:sugar transferase [Deltaproteobacteria bacterium]